MEVFVGGIAAALGSLGFFGGIALLIWAGNKGEAMAEEALQEHRAGRTLPLDPETL